MENPILDDLELDKCGTNGHEGMKGWMSEKKIYLEAQYIWPKPQPKSNRDSKILILETILEIARTKIWGV